MTSREATRLEPAHDTAWRAGRLDARSGRRRLLFGRVYEDSSIERAAFAHADRVFCIASAGCTALALSSEHAVVACDINPEQINYVTRRLQGGAREEGAAERVMRVMRWFMPLAGWSRPKLEAFLDMTDPPAQLAYFQEQLDGWRFRAGLQLLMSPLWLRGVYASALLDTLPPNFGAVLRARVRRCFARHPNRTNPYARALFLGLAEDEPLPAAARSRIELVQADAASYLERCEPATFGGIALSNILDGATPAYRVRLLAAVRRAARGGANVVQRSFGEPRTDVAMTANRAADDRSMLWGIVDVRSVEQLTGVAPGTHLTQARPRHDLFDSGEGI